MKVIHVKRDRVELAKAVKAKRYVYIGRPGMFGNPYVIGEHGSRNQVIALYEQWIRRSPERLAVIARWPEDMVLGCWCKPAACHGDVLVEIWKELHNAKLAEEVTA